MPRITQQQMVISAHTNLQSNLSRMSALQEKLSSGKEITKPSDNPSGTATALQYRSSIRRSDQYIRNADDGMSWLASADSALMGVQNVLNRAREVALQGTNALMTPTDREALAKEVEGLRDSALALANTTRLGRPIFSGNVVPVSPVPDSAYDPTYAYVGDAGAVMRTVADGVTVRVNLTGPEVFGPAGGDVFTTLTQLAGDLRTNPAALPAATTAIDAASTRVLTGLSTIGARTNQIETARDRTDLTRLSQQGSLAEIESIDLPKVLTDLKLQETSYQAALTATARTLQPSLMDFLR
jgi:flagellar hook-associated protein 3 FlgL